MISLSSYYISLWLAKNVGRFYFAWLLVSSNFAFPCLKLCKPARFYGNWCYDLVSCIINSCSPTHVHCCCPRLPRPTLPATPHIALPWPPCKVGLLAPFWQTVTPHVLRVGAKQRRTVYLISQLRCWRKKSTCARPHSGHS